jgi:hypothetical protein
MLQHMVSFQTFGLLLTVGLLIPQTPEVMSADLKPPTLEAFGRYIQATEARIAKELAHPETFLYVDGLPGPRRAEVRAMLQRGEVFMERLKTQDASGREMKAPDALIHHWMGAVFIPCATLRQTLEVAQDYDRHQDIYQPEVVRSKLVARNGNDFKIYYRLRKKKVITVTLNTDHDVHYYPVDATRCSSRSYATRVQQVANADKPDEYQKPVGRDSGFLWRIDSYWRFVERDGGVYVECESVSLTRDIPLGVSWLVKPFVTDIPKESLQMTMGSTRRAVAERVGTACAK